ncbi:P-loop NTPase fold protein [Vreelandella aquamarina]
MLNQSLTQFLSSSDSVAVIKGPWGVGKTHYWESYISGKQDELGTFNAYSYISLFGKTNLAELRKSIFHSAKPLRTDGQIEAEIDRQLESSNILLSKLPWLRQTKSKLPWINNFTKHARNLPFITKYAGALESIEYSLVSGYLVCIDDIERKGSALKMRELMGLVDELAVRKNCKVVLIFNNDSLDPGEDREQYEAYREKVVDIELTHNPSIEHNLSLVVESTSEAYEPIRAVCIALEIRNIRVIKKIASVLARFGSLIPTEYPKIYQSFVTHVSVLCWGYYIRDKDLSFESLCEQITNNSWMASLFDKDNAKSPAETKYRTLASGLQLSPFDLDEFVIQYLRSGLVEEGEVTSKVEALIHQAENNQASSRLSDAWALYSESFDDNLDEFLRNLRKTLTEEILHISLSDFGSAIAIMEEFGQDVADLVESYIEKHTETLANVDPHHPFVFNHVKNSAIKNKIEELRESNRVRSIDEIALKIALERAWNPEDIDYLASLDSHDYKAWMKSSPDDLVTKVRSGLLTFRNMRSSSNEEQYQKVSEAVITALKEIASENEFNRRRIKYIYQVE